MCGKKAETCGRPQEPCHRRRRDALHCHAVAFAKADVRAVVHWRICANERAGASPLWGGDGEATLVPQLNRKCSFCFVAKKVISLEFPVCYGSNGSKAKRRAGSPAFRSSSRVRRSEVTASGVKVKRSRRRKLSSRMTSVLHEPSTMASTL